MDSSWKPNLTLLNPGVQFDFCIQFSKREASKVIDLRRDGQNQAKRFLE